MDRFLIFGSVPVGDWERARETYEEMLATGVQPDAMVFAVLMDVAARAGQVDKSFELLHSMVHHSGIAPTAEVYSTLVSRFKPIRPDFLKWSSAERLPEAFA